MKRIWHRIVGHEHRWRRDCRLCMEVRFHDVHEPIDYCSCGAWRRP